LLLGLVNQHLCPLQLQYSAVQQSIPISVHFVSLSLVITEQ